MLRIFADIEFDTELFDDFLRNLSFKHFQKLNILTAVKLNLQNTNRLLLVLIWQGAWCQIVDCILRFDCRIG